MGHASPCVLGLFLLNTLLYCGRAEDALLTLEPNWSTFYTGESVTFICDVMLGVENEWEYSITKDGQTFIQHNTQKLYKLQHLWPSYSAAYQCFCYDKYTHALKRSNIISLNVSAEDKPKATLLPGTTTVQIGGSVTLICSVNGFGWKYHWYRQNSDMTGVGTNKSISISQGGIYRCIGSRGIPYFYTHTSDEVIIWITYSNRVTVTLQPNWPQFFSGETITLRCDIQGGGDIEWFYEWKTTWSSSHWTNVNYWTTSASESRSDYMCRGRHIRDTYSWTDWSNNITIMTSPKPKAQLSADTQHILVGGSVTLTCSVSSSSGWKYNWYRDDKSSEPLNTRDGVFQTTGTISVSQEGVYWCRGGRGDPVYYTDYSQSVSIYNIVPNRAVVSLQPNWPEIFRGERITVSCEIQGGGDTEWTYEWETTSSSRPLNQHEHRISSASQYHSGDYRCKGRMKSAIQSISTKYSDTVTLRVSNKPRPVVTVSPSWLSPGASVTLKCQVEHPSAGWRFFWYKTVPELSDNSYSYELLPGSSNGTEQDSYIIHGQTHTAGYVCRAGRGDPVYYTQYSDAKFVWSGEFHPSASLTVSPDSVQHFLYESVSLNCEGNSTEWGVKMFLEGGLVSRCSSWGIMRGSVCKIQSLRNTDAVYWCESRSGELSNAVNITTGNSIILVSPIHHVTEGASVTLSCKLMTGNVLSNVIFYKNDKLIQNDTRWEMTIPAVSKSHEGFYKCEGKNSHRALQSLTSKQSWMSVKSVSEPESALFPILLIVGLVCGLLLIILLLLFFRYRKSKDSCFIRSQSTNWSSATDHMIKQAETISNPCLYESIKDPEDTENDVPMDVAYSLTEFKNIAKNDDSLMYAQLLFNNKGKPAPAAADQTVYSEVKLSS